MALVALVKHTGETLAWLANAAVTVAGALAAGAEVLSSPVGLCLSNPKFPHSQAAG